MGGGLRLLALTLRKIKALWCCLHGPLIQDKESMP
jgi:hypothetical protein